MFKFLKKLIVRSPLHPLAIRIKSWWITRKWSKESDDKLKLNTVYCISPYKTGTTFLASCFSDDVSRHEPLHYTSIHRLNQNFEQYFVSRLNFLELKLECSGFLSAYVDKLAQTEATKDLRYICILRKPSEWVTSVVNHHKKVKDSQHHFFWGNELFWKKHAGVDLASFFSLQESKKLQMIENLIDFYMSFTKKTKKLKNVEYIWLEDLEDTLPEIGALLNEEVQLAKSKRNKAIKKAYVYRNDQIDAQYEQLVQELVA